MSTVEDISDSMVPSNLLEALQLAWNCSALELDMNEHVIKYFEETFTSFQEEGGVEEFAETLVQLIDPMQCDEDKVEVVRKLIEFVQNIETADEFCRVGGCILILPCLNSSHSEFVAETLKLIAELAQDNPQCQEEFLRLDVMYNIIQLLSDSDEEVAHQSMHALSCMVRQYKPGQEMFHEIGGLECILGCLQSFNENLRIESSRLMTSLCAESELIRDDLIKLDAVERTIASIEPTGVNNLELETALSTLNILTKNVDAVRRCRNSNLNLKLKLEAIKTLNEEMSDSEDQITYSNNLLQRCFSVEKVDNDDR